MKKFFLIMIGLLSVVGIQATAISQEVTPMAASEAVNRTQYVPADAVNNVAPAVFLSAPVSTNKKKKDLSENANFVNYMRYVQRNVQAKWYPPAFDQKRTAVIVFSVARNGKVFNSKVSSSSGDILFDRSSKDAVDTLISLLPLPSDVEPNFVDMQFTFDSASFGNNCHCISFYNTSSDNFKNVSNGSVSSSIYNSYVEEIDRIVSYNSPQRQYFFPKTASISFKVEKNGNISNFVIQKSTRCKKYRKDIEKSIKLAVFPAIPDSLDAESLDFDYNLTSPEYVHTNKNLVKCGAASVARAFTILRTGH